MREDRLARRSKTVSGPRSRFATSCHKNDDGNKNTKDDHYRQAAAARYRQRSRIVSRDESNRNGLKFQFVRRDYRHWSGPRGFFNRPRIIRSRISRNLKQ